MIESGGGIVMKKLNLYVLIMSLFFVIIYFYGYNINGVLAGNTDEGTNVEITTEETYNTEAVSETETSNVKKYKITEEQWLKMVKTYLPKYHEQLENMSAEERRAEYIKSMEKSKLANSPVNTKNKYGVSANKNVSVTAKNGDDSMEFSNSGEIKAEGELSSSTKDENGQIKVESNAAGYVGANVKSQMSGSKKMGDYDVTGKTSGKLDLSASGESVIKYEQGSKGVSFLQKHGAGAGLKTDFTFEGDVDYKGDDLFNLMVSPKTPGLAVGAGIMTGFSLKTDDIGLDLGGKLLMGADFSYHYNPENYARVLEDTVPGFENLDSRIKLLGGALAGLKLPMALATAASNPIGGAVMAYSALKPMLNSSSSDGADTGTQNTKSNLKYAGSTQKGSSGSGSSTGTGSSNGGDSESSYYSQACAKAAAKVNPEKDPERYKRLVESYVVAYEKANAPEDKTSSKSQASKTEEQKKFYQPVKPSNNFLNKIGVDSKEYDKALEQAKKSEGTTGFNFDYLSTKGDADFKYSMNASENYKNNADALLKSEIADSELLASNTNLSKQAFTDLWLKNSGGSSVGSRAVNVDRLYAAAGGYKSAAGGSFDEFSQTTGVKDETAYKLANYNKETGKNAYTQTLSGDKDAGRKVGIVKGDYKVINKDEYLKIFELLYPDNLYKDNTDESLNRMHEINKAYARTGGYNGTFARIESDGKGLNKYNFNSASGVGYQDVFEIALKAYLGEKALSDK